MHLTFRNVNSAFVGLVKGINSGSIPTKRCSSRNGPVRMIEEPVTITYEKPLERVLFNSARDANPFFHLYESLYMLSGGNLIAPLAYYAKNIENYSDDGVTQNGAYGYRWRHGSWAGTGDGIDQLDSLINHLKGNPSSRRAVLQMWSVEDDLLKIDTSKDCCCNLSVMFSIREHVSDGAHPPHPDWKVTERFLDMTVTNRSNDLVWGTTGANVVHFSFLLEYVAAHLGVEVGVYNQFSNNMHVYEANWKPEEWLAADNVWGYSHYFDKPEEVKTVPLVKNPKTFDEELPKFVEHYSGKTSIDNLGAEWKEPFLADAGIMLTAFACHKERDYHTALTIVGDIESDDWKIVAQEWLERREKNYTEK